MQVHCAQIVDEPENAPVLVLAHSEAELIAKLKVEGALSFLPADQLAACETLDDIHELYDNNRDDLYDYAGLFCEVQEL